MSQDPPALTTALEERAAGRWPVVVSPIDAPGDAAGKAPIGKAWGVTPPTERSLREAFRRIPTANLGLKLGAEGGVVDLDVDQPEHAAGTLARMFPDGIPPTRGWANKDGRFHLLFIWDNRFAKYGKAIIKGVARPDGKIVGNRNYLGLEIRIGAAPGQKKQFQSVIPPSPLADGTPRRWNDHPEILPAPECLFDDLDRYATEPRQPTTPPPPPVKGPDATRQDEAVAPVEAYARAAFEREVDAVAAATHPGRNDRLNDAAFALGTLVGAGALTRHEVELALTDAAGRAGLGADETRKTIRSGLDAGAAEPRDLSAVGRNGHHHRTAGVGSVGFVGASPQGTPPFDGPPSPLTIDLLPVHPINQSLIPIPLRGWLADIARRGCFPLEYPVAIAIVVLSILLGRNLTIRPKRHDNWTVVPNLWGAIVGPPGVQKSPAVDEVLLIIKRFAAEAMAAHEEAVRQAVEDAAVAEALAGAAKKRLAEAARKGEPEAVLRRLAADACKPEAAPPRPRRYIVNDVTVEKLGELFGENERGIFHYRDELNGFLRSMDRQGHESDRGFYLETWTGNGSYVFDRIGRGTVHVDALCLSIFGTVQPGPLARYLKGAAAGDDADGFVPRFQILVYPDAPARFVNVDEWPDTVAKARATEVFRWVDGLNPADMGVEYDDDRGLHFLRFDDAGQAVFDEWREALENRLRSGSESPLMACHLAKYRSLMPSLALILHVVGSVGATQLGPVTEAAALAAAAWCDLLESHARRIYQSASEGDPEAAARLAERIKQSLPNPFTFRQVANKGWSALDDVDAVRKAVGILEDRNWVKVVTRPLGPSGGRPSEEVWINPAVRGDQGADS